MDINKEREAFELLEHIKPYLNNVIFDQCSNTYISEDICEPICNHSGRVVNSGWLSWQAAKATPEGFVLEQKNWISVEIGTPAKFGTRFKIKRKSWDEEDNLVFIESEATYDKDSDFCELSNRSYEYETWFDHSLNKYLEEDELTHWMPLTKEAQEQSND